MKRLDLTDVSSLQEYENVYMQHLYVYDMLVFQATLTFLAQVSDMSLITLFVMTAVITYICLFGQGEWNSRGSVVSM